MKKYTFGLLSMLIFIGSIFSSCEEIDDFTTSLVTEEVIYLSGERVRLLGRVITVQEVRATDHGFYISTNESFGQPLIISLGERLSPGRFIGETSALQVEQRYFVKSFLQVDGELIFGNTLELTTLQPASTSLQPNNGRQGDVINILGRNFTADSRVFFGETEGQVIGIDFESRIRVRIPVAEAPVVSIKVISQGREMIVPDLFEYTIGTYKKISEFPRPQRYFDNVFLQQGTDFYVGLGTDRRLSFNPEMWKFNILAQQWYQVSFEGRPVRFAFNSSQYFGSGSLFLDRLPFFLVGDFWKLEADGSFLKLPDVPFVEANALAFELNGNLYVAGGENGFGQETYRYTPTTGTWMRVNNTPFRVTKANSSFVYEGKFYILNPETREIFAYTPETDSWAFVTNYPGLPGGTGGFGAVIDGRAYIGMENRSNRIWELNMSNLNWALKNDFPGVIQASNVGVYVHSGLIYFLRSADLQLPGNMELWEFDPKGFN
ncbi:IPT/TIG domain-containing protein [Mongoliitalea daihaiensis]|uniref:IPT/TIG domain-containing protein n=1 Tax=Mongoliitalea daihaiensis TaxID=2782006 RepID=UPI001F30868E|nr:IPT/TIG domain-containing protein [Mongoliitalea daihaiensis]UJP65603.1 IPT/TIG domain-containing protein [Mongoliitalea daihaiensis]